MFFMRLLGLIVAMAATAAAAVVAPEARMPADEVCIANCSSSAPCARYSTALFECSTLQNNTGCPASSTNTTADACPCLDATASYCPSTWGEWAPSTCSCDAPIQTRSHTSLKFKATGAFLTQSQICKFKEPCPGVGKDADAAVAWVDLALSAELWSGFLVSDDKADSINPDKQEAFEGAFLKDVFKDLIAEDRWEADGTMDFFRILVEEIVAESDAAKKECKRKEEGSVKCRKRLSKKSEQSESSSSSSSSSSSRSRSRGRGRSSHRRRLLSNLDTSSDGHHLLEDDGDYWPETHLGDVLLSLDIMPGASNALTPFQLAQYYSWLSGNQSSILTMARAASGIVFNISASRFGAFEPQQEAQPISPVLYVAVVLVLCCLCCGLPFLYHRFCIKTVTPDESGEGEVAGDGPPAAAQMVVVQGVPLPQQQEKLTDDSGSL